MITPVRYSSGTVIMVLLAALCLCLFRGLVCAGPIYATDLSSPPASLRSFTLHIWLAHQHSNILPGSLLQSTHHLILKPDLVRCCHLLISPITVYTINQKPPRCCVKGRPPETIPSTEIRPMSN